MAYFSRLTDIVTCSLTELLSKATDPQQALSQIITEMREGLAGAERSVGSARRSEGRIRKEIEGHSLHLDRWLAQAKSELAAGEDAKARVSLIRKKEVEDLLEGLSQELQTAIALREHLTTMLRALEARLADACRRQQQLDSCDDNPQPSVSESTLLADFSKYDSARSNEIESELAELKRQLGKDEPGLA
ncbi:MAG: PspA/IM30 family protein [Planctomycetota bacterium]|nr:PspA/IM30 family protein [Planctomycetota bacterium]